MSVSRIPTGGIPARLPDPRSPLYSREHEHRDGAPTGEEPGTDQLDLSSDWFDRIAPRVLLGEVLSLLAAGLGDTGVDLDPLERQREQLRHVGELNATVAALKLRDVLNALRGPSGNCASADDLDLAGTVETAVLRGVANVSEEYGSDARRQEQVVALLRDTSDRMLAAAATTRRATAS